MTAPLIRLSDELLLSRLDDLALRERRITLGILDHLSEADRRELHLKQGYGSLFSYCTGRLEYSASAASRRIRTMRCVRRFPSVLALLDHNDVNLSTVSCVAGILTDANHIRVLERIKGRSQRQVEVIAAEFKPRGRVRDSVRPVCVRPAPEGASLSRANPTLMCEYDRSGRGISVAPTVATAVRDEAFSPTLANVPVKGSAPTYSAPEKERTTVANGNSANAIEAVKHSQSHRENQTASLEGHLAKHAGEDPGEHSGEHPAEHPEKQFIIRFAAGSDLLRQIEAARSLLSFRVPATAPLEQVFGAVLSDFLERNDPARRAERRARRIRGDEKVRETAGSASAPVREPRVPVPARENGGDDGSEHRNDDGIENRRDDRPRTATTKADPRAIPAAVRDRVFAEAGNLCEYVSPSGRRCDATMHLQIDHVVPVALGGTATRTNLRVLCGRHNRLESRRLLGDNARVRGRRAHGLLV